MMQSKLPLERTIEWLGSRKSSQRLCHPLIVGSAAATRSGLARGRELRPLSILAGPMRSLAALPRDPMCWFLV